MPTLNLFLKDTNWMKMVNVVLEVLYATSEGLLFSSNNYIGSESSALQLQCLFYLSVDKITGIKSLSA